MVNFFLWCVGRERVTLLYMVVKEKAKVGCNAKRGLDSQALRDSITAIIFQRKVGNAYCKKFIYTDVKDVKSERQNQLYIEQSKTGKFVCSL